jgi:anti-sigma B factor antagonist
MPELVLEVSADGDSKTVRCAGRLTLTSVPLLRHEVKPLMPGTRLLTIDLGAVTMMDSVGLGTIVALYVSAKNAGCDLQITNLSPHIREIFSVTRLLSLFEACGESNIKLP